jgi:hypothetical protein
LNHRHADFQPSPKAPQLTDKAWISEVESWNILGIYAEIGA